MSLEESSRYRGTSSALAGPRLKLDIIEATECVSNWERDADPEQQQQQEEDEQDEEDITRDPDVSTDDDEVFGEDASSEDDDQQ